MKMFGLTGVAFAALFQALGIGLFISGSYGAPAYVYPMHVHLSYGGK